MSHYTHIPRWLLIIALAIATGLTLNATIEKALGKQFNYSWQSATATWYGPGFYGNQTACGHTYTLQLRGTAHMRLACGAKVTICKRIGHNGRLRRCVRVLVVDRGAFHPNNFDLTARTAMDLCRCKRPYTQRVVWQRGWHR